MGNYHQNRVKGKLPLFHGNGERVITIYSGYTDWRLQLVQVMCWYPQSGRLMGCVEVNPPNLFGCYNPVLAPALHNTLLVGCCHTTSDPCVPPAFHATLHIRGVGEHARSRQLQTWQDTLYTITYVQVCVSLCPS